MALDSVLNFTLDTLGEKIVLTLLPCRRSSNLNIEHLFFPFTVPSLYTDLIWPFQAPILDKDTPNQA